MIRSFDTIEAMLTAIEDDRIEADISVQDWQNQLGPGDYFVRLSKVGEGPRATEVAIYCEVLDPSLPISSGPHDQEYLDELKESGAWYAETHMKNFRFCRAFSIFCEEGELGDVHISTAVLKISKENFEAARQHGWRPGFHGSV